MHGPITGPARYGDEEPEFSAFVLGCFGELVRDQTSVGTEPTYDVPCAQSLYQTRFSFPTD